MSKSAEHPATSPTPGPSGPPAPPTLGPRFWIFVCAGLALVLYFMIPGLGAWIELFNGATWPESLAHDVQTDPVKRIPFALVLAVRTLLNLSGALIVLYAIYWFLFGGKAKAMEKTLANVRAVQYASLEFHLVTFLRKHDGEAVGPELVEQFKSHMQEWVTSDLAAKLDKDLAKVSVESGLGA